MLTEEALHAVQTASKITERIDTPDAKRLLRATGAPHLAARLGRLSKGRNAEAHPDVGLARDIARHYGDVAGEPPARLERQSSSSTAWCHSCHILCLALVRLFLWTILALAALCGRALTIH